MADINGLSIAELEKLINSRKSVLTGLYSRRDHLARQMDAINAEIAAAEGSAPVLVPGGVLVNFRVQFPLLRAEAPSAAVTRAQNDKSLKAYVIDVLTANRRGLTLNEIQEAVLKVGYITNSANFKNTLYQCLYHNEDLFVLDKQTKCYKLGK